MDSETIRVGDRVINLQMPGIFVVVARHGRVLEIETADGVSMTVVDAAVRRLDDKTPTPAGA
jgi:preprotein translocase subunit YajC